MFYKKDISILARSGFDFETSKKVMEIEKDDYLRIVSLLIVYLMYLSFIPLEIK